MVTTLHDFEQGVLGDTVLASGDLSVTGTPPYVYGLHGKVGVQTSTDVNYLRYTVAADVLSGSVYFRINALPVGGATRVAVIRDTLNADMAQFRIHNTGIFQITDIVAGPTTAANAIDMGSCTVGATYQLNWKIDTANEDVIWGVTPATDNPPAQKEGASDYTIQAAVPGGGIPGEIYIGGPGSHATSDITIDTLRYDDDATPFWFDPIELNKGVFVWDGSEEIPSVVDTSNAASGYLNVKDYGAVGDGVNDDTAAIQAAIDAASTDGGGIIFLPAGEYKITAPLEMKSYCHIQGSEPATRYWGTSTTLPPGSCKIRIDGTFTPIDSAAFTIASGITAWSFRDITIAGNNVETVSGFTSVTGGTEDNGQFQNIAIIGMGGDGVNGDLHAVRFSSCFIGGCNGWGLNSTTRFVDVHVGQTYITSNKLGALQLAGTSQSGLCSFVSTRFERSGHKSDGVYYTNPNAPGIYINNAKDVKFVSCETDANTGHGVELTRHASIGNCFNIHFSSCDFRRDGSGDMDTDPQAAGVKITGSSGRSVDYVSFVDCYWSKGKSSDSPPIYPATYEHPHYGLDTDYAYFLKVIGGRLDAAVLDWNLTSNTYRPWVSSTWGTDGNTAVMIPSSGTPPVLPTVPELVGMQWFNTATKEVGTWDGNEWTYAQGEGKTVAVNADPDSGGARINGATLLRRWEGALLPDEAITGGFGGSAGTLDTPFTSVSSPAPSMLSGDLITDFSVANPGSWVEWDLGSNNGIDNAVRMVFTPQTTASSFTILDARDSGFGLSYAIRQSGSGSDTSGRLRIYEDSGAPLASTAIINAMAFDGTKYGIVSRFTGGSIELQLWDETFTNHIETISAPSTKDEASRFYRMGAVSYANDTDLSWSFHSFALAETVQDAIDASDPFVTVMDVPDLQNLVAASATYGDFQTAIAAL
jgi:hypothetical protein